MNGSLTLPKDTPTVFGLTLSLSDPYGLTLTLNKDGTMHTATATVSVPSASTVQVMLQHKISSGQNSRTLSLVASEVSWKDGMQLDITADDSADSQEAFNATLARSDSRTGSIWTLHSGETSATLRVSPGEDSTSLRLTVSNNGVQQLTGTAVLTDVEHTRSLTGSATGRGFDPMTFEATLDTAAAVPEPQWPEAPASLELLGLTSAE